MMGFASKEPPAALLEERATVNSNYYINDVLENCRYFLKNNVVFRQNGAQAHEAKRREAGSGSIDRTSVKRTHDRQTIRLSCVFCHARTIIQ